MCGRFIIFSEAQEREIENIVEEVNRKYGDNAMKKDQEVFPADHSPIITLDNGVKNISLFKWGFPNYKGGIIINARSETLIERHMFKNPFISKRCLIPVSAFFEWKQVDGKKKKYIISSSRTNFFYLAGLYDEFKDKQGEPFTAFVVITTSASNKMSAIHDRMPVILSEKNAIDLWVDNKFTDILKLQNLLIPDDNILITAS